MNDLPVWPMNEDLAERERIVRALSVLESICALMQGVPAEAPDQLLATPAHERFCATPDWLRRTS